MRNVVAALVFVIVVLAFVGVGAPANEEVHETEAAEELEVAKPEVAEPKVPTTCERYGQVAQDIVETRFPKPEPGPNARAYEGEDGYRGALLYATSARIKSLFWWCEREHLRLRVPGARVFYGKDIETALRNLLWDFHDRGLEPANDGIKITLEHLYTPESAHFDPLDERLRRRP
ncbi:MAG: hypothetical protein KJO40_20350 [Deltaproteobacteria bacterium]|nr:hypothetical protein [Deltaproteobacteria bacterium]NND28065.1 hypothetical protein [Myxococcales bacterium]MBT8464494.1 hypothetical protein [Deltaproteobacteria bacterium]MBT8480977.1 hypothetical protein [Deltaproteobacteria bacterium]NNK09083.1 hypothetical protein [Myxococcales bacterium]